MECPKCKTKITDDMLICPNCKKVLKLVCPKCNTINKSNICHKCGFHIITKCYKCGKINNTISGKCSKCGFSTYTSVAISSSNIDEFACLTIEFPNLNDLKSVLGSTKLSEKFKVKLDELIKNYTGNIGINREIIENIYIIRFNRDFSFKVSAKNAMNAAIEIQKLITNLNVKLNKAKDALLECKIAILKRDIYANPEDYKSGFNIKLIYENKKELKVINALQIITDSSVYEELCDEFELKSLTSTFIKNQMVMFFELNLKKYIKIEKEKPENNKKPKPVLIKETIEEDAPYNETSTNLINFEALKCNFTSSTTLELIQNAINIFKTSKQHLVAVKAKNEFYPQSAKILKELENTNLFNNIYRVTCHKKMKYKPYGFFNELITGIYNYSVTPKHFNSNQFEIFKQIDSSDFIKSLINLSERKFPHPEDVRYSLFDIFINIFAAMKNTLIYIENFENIDDTSLEFLQVIFEKLNNYNVSYLIFTDKNHSLHKKINFLLNQKNYTEIVLKPTYIQNIINKSPAKYEKILDSHYMKSIITYAKGSVLYFTNAIDYLLETKLLKLDKEILLIDKSETLFIPNTLTELITKRLLNLYFQDSNAFKLLALLVLTGPIADVLTIKDFQIQDDLVKIKVLADKNYIYAFNNLIYIQNYNLLKKAMSNALTNEQKKEFSLELLQKVYSSPIKHPNEIELYNTLEKTKQEFTVWEKLSNLNASMGDFSSYLNCSIKLLKLLENNIKEDSEKTIKEYKMEIYENISNLLYKYTPDKIYNISRIILDNLEKTINDKKVIELCNKMLQGCLISGNYSYALELTNKILSKFKDATILPDDKNFNISFFLISLIKIEVLFSIGNLKECEEKGEEILAVLTPENITKLKPENLSDKQLKEAINDAMTFAAASKVLLLCNESELADFFNQVELHTGKNLAIQTIIANLMKLLREKDFEITEDIEIIDDKFANVLLNILKAFKYGKKDYNKFANYIYQAKISTQVNKLNQLELICDLFIGYAYFKLNQLQKASSIYYNVIEISKQNGLKLITYIAWYLISMLKFNQNEIEISFGIANNAIIQLEKENNPVEYLLLLFRIQLATILTQKEEPEAAELCKQNAEFIKNKYKLE